MSEEQYYCLTLDDCALPSFISAQSMVMIDEIFALMRRLKPSLDNGGRELWLVAERGPIEDFGDVNEWIEEGYADDEDEFRRNWLAEYPEERSWYGLVAIEDEKYGIRALSLGHKTIYSWSKHMETIGEMEVAPFIAWVLESVKGCITELEQGTYNARIEAELPVRLRTGTIRRKDFWDVFPEQRTDFFKDITKEEINEFGERISQQPDDSRKFEGRVQGLTANTFYGYCALGYAANHYKYAELTPKSSTTAMRTAGTTGSETSIRIPRRHFWIGATTGNAADIRSRYVGVATQRTFRSMLRRKTTDTISRLQGMHGIAPWRRSSSTLPYAAPAFQSTCSRESRSWSVFWRPRRLESSQTVFFRTIAALGSQKSISLIS